MAATLEMSDPVISIGGVIRPTRSLQSQILSIDHETARYLLQRLQQLKITEDYTDLYILYAIMQTLEQMDRGIKPAPQGYTPSRQGGVL